MEEDFRDLPSNAQEAKSCGSKFYFVDKPCKNGHISKRYVSSRGCVACANSQEKHTKRMESYYENQDHNLKKRKDRYYQNRPAALEYSRKHYRENKEYYIKWEEENKDTRREQKRLRRNERYKTDPLYKAQVTCRNMLRKVLSISEEEKNSRYFDHLGYDNVVLVEDISSKFLDGMSWDNYGEWEIDHKHPVSRYAHEGITNPAIINSLDNLIPMWKDHNREKDAMTLKEYLECRPELNKLYGQFI